MRLLTAVLGCTAAAIAALTTPAIAAPVKIAFMNSLSSTSSVGAKQARDGFALALKELGGKFGGAETQVIWEDDEGKPDVGVTKAKTLIERDHVDAIVGFTFTNVAMAALKPIVESKPSSSLPIRVRPRSPASDAVRTSSRCHISRT